MKLTNTTKLNVAITKSGKTKKHLAQILNLSEMGLYKKINAITEFRASEIKILHDALNLTAEDVNSIFFDDCVELNSTSTQRTKMKARW